MANVELSRQDIDYIGRVVETEVPGYLRSVDPIEYGRMVNAVVDTVLSRTSTGRYGKTVKDVLNQPNAFSKINGPAKVAPYGSIQSAPKASKETQALVDQHVAERAMGKPAEIGGAVNYANPNFSDSKNLKGWIEPMIAAGALPLGVGSAVHYHGTAPGVAPASFYEVSKPFGFMEPVDPSVYWSDTLPTPTARPDVTSPAFGAAGARSMAGYVEPGRPGIGTPAAGAMGARSMAGWGGFPADTVGTVTRSSLPDLAFSPAAGARAASELQGITSPAAGARAASGLQTYTPGNITLPDIPAALSTPPSFGIPSLPATAPTPTSRPQAAIPSMPAPVDRSTVQSLPSVATPPTGLSISLPTAVPPTTVATTQVSPAAIGSFPAPPPAPGRQGMKDAAIGGLKGAATGGLPGAILGAVLGPAMAQIGRNVASNHLGVGSRINPFNGVLGAYKNLFSPLGSMFGSRAPAVAPYSVGSGLAAIGSIGMAPPGATAFSRSNPSVSYTSLGGGLAAFGNSATGQGYTVDMGQMGGAGGMAAGMGGLVDSSPGAHGY